MTMPIDLILVRHGESEGNVANRLSRKGDNRHFTKGFLERHSSSWRLSDRGREQAISAGKWIMENCLYVPVGVSFKKTTPKSSPFDRHYTSEYIRAMETAALLGLPCALWYREVLLRERDWGDLDVMPDDKRKNLFSKALEKRQASFLLWRPPNGESLADMMARLLWILSTLHRECTDKRVVIVCHGEVMWGFRTRLERITTQKFHELEESDDPKDHIYNCQILHYTRRNPKTGRLTAHLGWMKSVCPWDTARSSNTWQEIHRPRYNNDELLLEVQKVKRTVAE